VSFVDETREQDLVVRLFPQQAKLKPTLHCLTGTPPQLEVRHRGFVIEPRFPFEYPFAPPLIYLRPAPRSRHYYVHPGEQEPRLCWCRPEDWSPRLRLLVAVCSAMRFINDYLDGRVD
jgi:ubiquitin-protein ligase